MSVNKWIGIGNLTKDVEIKYTPSGVAVCNFSVACNERYKDKDGQQQEKVEFVNIVAWRQLAEICGKFLHKGKQVYLEGKLTTRKWQDRDGNDRYSSEIVIDEMQMLGSKSDSQQASPQQQPQQQEQAPVFDEEQDRCPF